MPGPVTRALEQWRQGDLNAQWDLKKAIQPFWERMLQYVRDHRAPDLQTPIQTEAVVNSAFRVILTGIDESKFPDLTDHHALEKFMTTLVKRTLFDAIRYNQSQCRNPGLRQPLDSAIPDPGETQLPEEFLENFLEVMRPVHPLAMDIVKLRLEGFSNLEIADKLSLAPGTVQVILR